MVFWQSKNNNFIVVVLFSFLFLFLTLLTSKYDSLTSTATVAVSLATLFFLYQMTYKLTQTHKTLIEKDKLLQTAMQAAKQTWFEINLLSGMMKTTASYFEMFGYKSLENSSTLHAWIEDIHPDDTLKVKSALYTLQHETDETSIVYRRKNSQNTYLWIHSTAVVIERNETFQAVRIAGIHKNITHIKQREEELLEAKRHAEEATLSKSQFLANMSHEIRTPMNGIIGMSHLALQTDLTERQKNYLQKIENSAKSLLGIINDILDLSKIEAGKLSVENLRFDLHKVIEQVIGFIELKAHEKGLELIVHYDESVGKFYIGDALRLTQVLTNLMGNAVKFTGQGEIVLSVSHIQKNRLKFEVIDSGIGMTKPQQAKLFESFSQAEHHTTQKFGGTGLGLAISKKLVELMNGTIGCESESEKGSRFYFEIESKKAKSNQEICRKFDAQKVLIAEDNLKQLQALQTLLERFNLISFVAYSTKEALKLIHESHIDFDLILIDTHLLRPKELDEMFALYQTYSLDKTRQAPSIILMANSYERELFIGENRYKTGYSYLHKPFNPSELNLMLSQVFCDFTEIKAIHAPNKIESDTSYIFQKALRNNLSSLKGSRILLVEDNEMSQEILIGFLEGSGIIIDIANNGREAVEMFKKNQSEYELILMDIQMPIMGGFEASKEIRQIDRNIPIFALSANAMKEDVERSKMSGMNGHLQKPIEIEKLYQTLLEHLSPKTDIRIQNESEEQILLPQMTSIDTNTGIVYCANNATLYIKILRDFADKYRTMEFFELPDDLFKRTIHTLKGHLASIGAHDVHLMASQINQTQDKTLLPAFTEALKKIIDEIDSKIEL